MLKKIALTLFITFLFLCASIIPSTLIHKIVRLQVPNKVIGFHVHTHRWDEGYFHAEGTWVMERGQKDNFLLLNKSIIKCEKKKGYCTEAYVALSAPRDFPVILYLNEYPIEKWDDKHIVYAHKDVYSRMIVTVARETKHLTTTYVKLRDDSNRHPLLKFDIDPNRVERLVDGYEVMQNLEADAFPATLAWIFGIALGMGYIYALYRLWSNKARKESSKWLDKLLKLLSQTFIRWRK